MEMVMLQVTAQHKKIVQQFRLTRLDHDITALGEELFKQIMNMCISHSRWNFTCSTTKSMHKV